MTKDRRLCWVPQKPSLPCTGSPSPTSSLLRPGARGCTQERACPGRAVVTGDPEEACSLYGVRKRPPASDAWAQQEEQVESFGLSTLLELTPAQESAQSSSFQKTPTSAGKDDVFRGGATEGCSRFLQPESIHPAPQSRASQESWGCAGGNVTSSPNCGDVCFYMKSQDKGTACLVFTSGSQCPLQPPANMLVAQAQLPAPSAQRPHTGPSWKIEEPPRPQERTTPRSPPQPRDTEAR